MHALSEVVTDPLPTVSTATPQQLAVALAQASSDARLRAEAEAELAAVEAEACAEAQQHERELGSALDELEKTKAELVECRRQIGTCLETEAYLQSKLTQADSRVKKLRADCKKLSRELSARAGESSKVRTMLRDLIRTDRILSQRLSSERANMGGDGGGRERKGTPVAEGQVGMLQAQLQRAQATAAAKDALIAELSARLADYGLREGDDEVLRGLRKRAERARKQETQFADSDKREDFDSLLHKREQKLEQLATAWDQAAEDDGYRRADLL